MTQRANRALRFVLLFYGALSAVLYTGLLPLWDGFDEPFHYGYVRQLSRLHTLPVHGRAVLSEEIVRSLDLVPTTYVVRGNIWHGIVFDDYVRLSGDERRGLRRRLESIDPASAAVDGQFLNYEAHQAPLAYAVLAPFDVLWAGLPLPARILRLRLLGALLSVLFIWIATFRLGGLLGVSPTVPLSVTFVVFSSQMFYGSVCHIANDWLAIPLFTLVLCETVALHLSPRAWQASRLALALGAGLLTKAYFLAAVPLAMGVTVVWWVRDRRTAKDHHPLRRWMALVPLAGAAPWYMRNLALYRNLSGMQETLGGTHTAQLARAALHVPWAAAALATARTSLWTGNNSLVALSWNTTRVMLLLLLASACTYLVRVARGRATAAERVLAVGIVCFGSALVYSAVLTFWSTNGAGFSPAPWYVQVLLAPGFCLLFIGLSCTGPVGRFLHVAIVGVWAYVIAVTYAVKLLPFYAGFTAGTAHLSDLPHWYTLLSRGSYGSLDTAALLSPRLLLPLIAAAITLAGTLAIALSALSSFPPAISGELQVHDESQPRRRLGSSPAATTLTS